MQVINEMIITRIENAITMERLHPRLGFFMVLLDSFVHPAEMVRDALRHR
jgi:hypothetical protein